MGYKDKPDLQKFCEYYNARVEDTGNNISKYNGTHTTMLRPDVIETERILSIQMPESMLHELTTNHSAMISEMAARRNNLVLMDMWHKYQMMLQMYK